MKKKLLSVLVALSMALALVPVSVLAEGENAITEDTTTLSSGGSYILNSNIDLKGTLTVPGNAKNVTIDLNGHKLTAPNGRPAIKVEAGGVLEIKGENNGSEITRPKNSEAYVILNNGTLTLSSGTVSSPEDSKTVTTIRNRTAANDKTGAKLIVNGGTVDGNYIAIGNDRENRNDAAPELIVTDGEIKGRDQAVQNWGNATIKDGNFSGCFATWSDGKECGNTEITGGTFDLANCDVDPVAVIGVFQYSGGNDKATLKISGNPTVTGTSDIPAVAVAKWNPSTGKNEPVNNTSESVSIKITGGTFSSKVDFDKDHSFPIELPNGEWTVMSIGKQTIVVRENGPEDETPDAKYGEAYTKAGLTLSTQAADGSYTLTIDEAKLEAVVKAGKDETNELHNTFKTLENKKNPNQLWFGMEYRVPANVNGIEQVSVQFDDGEFSKPQPLDNKNGNGFYNYIKVYKADADGNNGQIRPVEGETAIIKWLDKDGKILAVTKADVKVELDASTKHTVTFNSKDGSAIPAQKVSDGAQATKPTDPTKTGYVFIGWYTDDGVWKNEFKFETPIKGNITLYARWAEDKKCKITLNLNNGSEIGIPQEYDAGKWMPKPNLGVEWDGHEITGWYTDKDCTAANKVEFPYRVVEDITLYAKWESDAPRLTFAAPGAEEDLLGKKLSDLMEGTLTFQNPDEKHVVKVTGKAKLIKDWTQFSSIEGEQTGNYLPVVITANKACEVTVKGSKETKIQFTDDKKTEILIMRLDELANKTFTIKAGSADNAITYTIDFTGVQCVKELYTVSFDLDGGSGTFASQSVLPGKTATDPGKPTKTGYTFNYWAKKGSTTRFDFSTPINEDTVLCAQWTKVEEKPDPTPTEYTVTFNSQGGSAVDSVKVENGKTVAEPSEPTRTGYLFAGWYTDSGCTEGNKVSFPYTVTGNVTLYAKWSTGESNNPDGEYAITISSSIRHGYVGVSQDYAKPGERILITVDPDTDYLLDWLEVESGSGSVYWSRSGKRHFFTMPASDVTINAEFYLQAIYSYSHYWPVDPVEPVVFKPTFTPIAQRYAVVMRDVPSYSWAYQPARWAYENGYLDLAVDGSFRINDPVSHQQMWRIMAQWLNAPAMNNRELNNWALQNGATKGKPASSAMTRQDVVTYLYQCYFLMGGDVSVTGNLSQYVDSRLITSVPARNAWTWAINKGIISGTATGYLNPSSTVSRGEFAAILMRLCQNA